MEAPFAFVDLDAMWANAEEMLRAGGGEADPGGEQVAPLPRRCSSGSSTATSASQGLMTFTLPETLWLAEQGFENLLLAYPTADRGALGELALRSAPTPTARRS